MIRSLIRRVRLRVWLDRRWISIPNRTSAAALLKLHSAPFRPPVLDLGCGTGQFTVALASRGCRLVAFDLILERLQWLHGITAEYADLLDIELVSGNGLSLPFKDAAFGTLICNSVLEHIEDDRRAVSALMTHSQPLPRRAVPLARGEDTPGRLVGVQVPGLPRPRDRPRRAGRHHHRRDQAIAGPPVTATAVRRQPPDHPLVQLLPGHLIPQQRVLLSSLRAAVPPSKIPEHLEPGQVRVIPPPLPRPRSPPLPRSRPPAPSLPRPVPDPGRDCSDDRPNTIRCKTARSARRFSSSAACFAFSARSRAFSSRCSAVSRAISRFASRAAASTSRSDASVPPNPGQSQP